MRRRVIGAVVGLGLLALPATSLGGGQTTDSVAQATRAAGELVAKDSAKRRPAASTAWVTLTDFGKVSYAITSNPEHLPIDWAYTVRCVKGSLIDYFPGPGDLHTTTKQTSIRGTFPIPLADPDSCTFAVSGQIASDRGKRVFTKIYKQG